ncbi:hypothetical protein SDC9_174313 [bioreactor metagenome]|uniref:DUF7000 domain-containing protein n=2 Tax=root TaxID=1 RepID=A0A1W1IHG2_9LACT|nr:hypothetical protein [Trichococcus pasteurii]SFE52707.1 hypothetical protein SAMN04488086_10560 [Trichococcus pasteurii]SLM52424.1 Hypothetical protein TPAS_2118 [Trichococcus pasteurii]SSB93305.1 Hypothetical protein TPAS_2118 [Trichococcus pasteurii]
MEPINECIMEYTAQLSKGQIQKAYKGIMTFMSELRSYLESKYPDYTAGNLYFGYMDMTYFAFTPVGLKNKKLKIAVVYLHEKGVFEVWLAGNNRKIQAEYIALMSSENIGIYKLSQVIPGVDSIIESTLVEEPDFDHPEALKRQIEKKTMAFVKDIISVLDKPQGVL